MSNDKEKKSKSKDSTSSNISNISTTEKVLLVIAFTFIIIMFVMVFIIRSKQSDIRKLNKQSGKNNTTLTNISYYADDSNIPIELNNTTLFSDNMVNENGVFTTGDIPDLLVQLNKNNTNNSLNSTSITNLGDTPTGTIPETISITNLTSTDEVEVNKILSYSTLTYDTSLDNSLTFSGKSLIVNELYSSECGLPTYSSDWTLMALNTRTQFEITGMNLPNDLSNGVIFKILFTENYDTDTKTPGPIYDISSYHVDHNGYNGWAIAFTSNNTITVAIAKYYLSTIETPTSNPNIASTGYYKLLAYF